jgi:hypothetical protein
VKRGCLIVLLVGLAVGAVYYRLLHEIVDPPGDLLLTIICVPMLLLFVNGLVGKWLWGSRDQAALRRAQGNEPMKDGRLEAAIGAIHPLAAPLQAPFSGSACVAYQYEMKARLGDRKADAFGFALTPSVIRTSRGDVRLLGWGLLDQFPEERAAGDEAAARARAYLVAARPEALGAAAVVKMIDQMDEVFVDDDGAVRKDWKLTDEDLPWPGQMITERRVSVGETVCALGIFSTEKGGLVPRRGRSINRLYRGSGMATSGRLEGEARSMLGAGTLFFLVSHAFLAAVVYLSATKYRRMSPAEQARELRAVLAPSQLARLERMIDRGADPNAPNAGGEPLLLDTRDLEVTELLIRKGVDVNARSRDGDTALMQASRYGFVEIVQALLKAGAQVDLETPDGRNALSEAIRGERPEVVEVLRAAGAQEPKPR